MPLKAPAHASRVAIIIRVDDVRIIMISGFFLKAIIDLNTAVKILFMACPG